MQIITTISEICVIRVICGSDKGTTPQFPQSAIRLISLSADKIIQWRLMWGSCKFIGGRLLVLHNASWVCAGLCITFALLLLPQDASAASRYWVGNGSNTNWNTTDNWATTSDGASGATVPGAGDDAILDGGGGHNGNLTFELGATASGLTLTADFSGDIDFGDSAFSHSFSGDMTFDGSGEVDLGNATITCSGNFDYEDQSGDWTRGASTLVMNGAAKTLSCKFSANSFYNLTIDGSVTVSVAAGGSRTGLYGTYTVNAGKSLTCSPLTNYVYMLAADAVVNGIHSGGLRTSSNGGNLSIGASGEVSGDTISIQGGTISVVAGGVCNPTTGYLGRNANINGALFGGSWSFTGGHSTRTLTIGSSITFSGDVSFNADVADNTYTVDNSGNYDLEFQGDVTLSESAGTLAWTPGTGTITLSGATLQTVDFLGKATEDIILTKSGGNLTLAGVNADLQKMNLSGALILSGGTLDASNDDPDVLITNDFTVSGATLLMGDGNWEIGGDFTQIGGGSITANSSTVTLTGTGDSTAAHSLSVSDSLNNLTLDNGLVGYWKFDEGAGSVARDSSANENDGTLTNFSATGTGWVSLGGGTGTTTFYNPYALDFDGVDDWVDLGHVSAWDFRANDAFTVMLWFKNNEYASGMTGDLFGKTSSSAGTIKHTWNLWYDSYGKLSFTLANGATSQIRSDFARAFLNTWHHVAVVVPPQNGDVTFYQDGVYQSGEDMTRTIGNLRGHVDSFFIGGKYTASYGLIDDVRIYNRALSASEVENLANGNPSTGSGYYTLGASLDIAGNLNNYTGNLVSSGGITIQGNWNNQGDFTHDGAGTVNFNGSSQTISGSTVFWNMTSTGASTDTLTFDYTSRQSVSGALTLAGEASNLLSLRTTKTGSASNILLDASAGTQSLTYLDVQDIDASGGLQLLARDGTSTDSGNTTNWDFDSTAPTVSTLTPLDGVTGVATTSNLVIVFDENIGKTGTGAVTIYLGVGDSLVETIAVTDSTVTGSGTDTITINPVTTLTEQTAYYVKIDAMAFPDESENTYAGISDTTTWNFTIGDFTNPTLSSTVPSDDATNIDPAANLTLALDENTGETGTGYVTIYLSSNDSIVEQISTATGTVTGSGTDTLTINPTVTLTDNTAYYIKIDAMAVPDSSGNTYAGISDATTWNFTTGDYTSPTVSILSPLDDATDVATSSNLVITFNEATGKTGTGYVTIYLSSNDSVVEQISTATGAVIGSGTVTITINPTTTLSASTAYYIKIDANAFPDSTGNVSFAGITDTETWNFTTAASGGGGHSAKLRRANLLKAGRSAQAGATASASAAPSPVQTSVAPTYTQIAQNIQKAQERPKTEIGALMETHRRLATVRGALVERFNDQIVRAKLQEDEKTVFADLAGESEKMGDTERKLLRARAKTRVHASALPRTAPSQIAERRGLLAAVVNDIEILFADVLVAAWYAPYVSFLIEEEIAQGYKDEEGELTGEFGVSNPVTRSEVLKMALEAAGEDLSETGTPRNNSAQGTWASAYVAKAEEMGISTFGKTVNVNDPATRGEVVQTLLEAMRLGIGKNISSYSDVPVNHQFVHSIATATWFGIIEGDTNESGNPLGTFRPDEEINRAEVSKIIALAKELLK